MNWDQLELLCRTIAGLRRATGVPAVSVYLSAEQWRELRGTMFAIRNNKINPAMMGEALTRGWMIIHGIDVRKK